LAIVYGEQIPERATRPIPALSAHERRSHGLFMLFLHPQRWTWDTGERDWLIELIRAPISGGVGGVGLDGNGRELVQGMVADRMARGQIPLQDGDPRLADPAFGCAGGHYLARHPALPHGYAVSCVWEGYEQFLTSVEWSEDSPRRVRFQRALESARIVPPMPPKAMDISLREARGRAKRLGDKLAKSPQFPSIRSNLEAAAEKVEAMVAAQSRRLAPPKSSK